IWAGHRRIRRGASEEARGSYPAGTTYCGISQSWVAIEGFDAKAQRRAIRRTGEWRDDASGVKLGESRRIAGPALVQAHAVCSALHLRPPGTTRPYGGHRKARLERSATPGGDSFRGAGAKHGPTERYRLRFTASAESKAWPRAPE